MSRGKFLRFWRSLVGPQKPRSHDLHLLVNKKRIKELKSTIAHLTHDIVLHDDAFFDNKIKGKGYELVTFDQEAIFIMIVIILAQHPNVSCSYSSQLLLLDSTHE